MEGGKKSGVRAGKTMSATAVKGSSPTVLIVPAGFRYANLASKKISGASPMALHGCVLIVKESE